MAKKNQETTLKPTLKSNNETKEVIEVEKIDPTPETKEVIEVEPDKIQLSEKELQDKINQGVINALKIHKEQEQKEQAEKDKKIKDKADRSVEAQEYEQFTELYFISLREGVTLKPEVKEKMELLGSKIKKRTGYMPKKSRTVFMGTGNGTIRIAKDYPVPTAIYKRFKGKASAWFN